MQGEISTALCLRVLNAAKNAEQNHYEKSGTASSMDLFGKYLKSNDHHSQFTIPVMSSLNLEASGRLALTTSSSCRQPMLYRLVIFNMSTALASLNDLMKTGVSAQAFY